MAPAFSQTSRGQRIRRERLGTRLRWSESKFCTCLTAGLCRWISSSWSSDYTPWISVTHYAKKTLTSKHNKEHVLYSKCFFFKHRFILWTIIASIFIFITNFIFIALGNNMVDCIHVFILIYSSSSMSPLSSSSSLSHHRHQVKWSLPCQNFTVKACQAFLPLVD